MTSMNGNLPAKMGDPMGHVRAAQLAAGASRRKFARDSDARRVLEEMGAYDRQFRETSLDQREDELRVLNVRIASADLSLKFLIRGVHRAYDNGKIPWNPIGAVITEAREARKLAGVGQVIRDLKALPAAPPSAGPVWQAYGEALGLECSKCGAGPGNPCTSAATGTPKRAPCMARKVESLKHPAE